MACKDMTADPGGRKPCSHYIELEDGSAGLCTMPDKFKCSEAVKSQAIMLSHSAAQTFMVCDYKFKLQNIDGIRLKPGALSIPIKMGQLWDRHVDLYCNGIAGGEYLRIMMDLIAEYSIPGYAVAKVQGVISAFDELGMKLDMTGFKSTQAEITYHHFHKDVGDVFVHGYMDRMHDNYFVENKFSSRPGKFTEEPFTLMSQVGTYFLAEPSMDYCVMEVVRVPSLRQKRGESDNDFADRIKTDVLSRPGYYFQGYDSVNNTYGVRFYRSDFEPYFEWLKLRYTIITKEIMQKASENSWYFHDASCKMYGSLCEYYYICKNGRGGINWDMYTRREKKQSVEEDTSEVS